MAKQHEMVSISRLLVLGGLAPSKAAAVARIAHGAVNVEQWTIGIAESTLPRWVLRGVTITCGERSMRISDDGCKILSESDGVLR